MLPDYDVINSELLRPKLIDMNSTENLNVYSQEKNGVLVPMFSIFSKIILGHQPVKNNIFRIRIFSQLIPQFVQKIVSIRYPKIN